MGLKCGISKSCTTSRVFKEPRKPPNLSKSWKWRLQILRCARISRSSRNHEIWHVMHFVQWPRAALPHPVIFHWPCSLHHDKMPHQSGWTDSVEGERIGNLKLAPGNSSRRTSWVLHPIKACRLWFTLASESLLGWPQGMYTSQV